MRRSRSNHLKSNTFWHMVYWFHLTSLDMRKHKEQCDEEGFFVCLIDTKYEKMTMTDIIVPNSLNFPPPEEILTTGKCCLEEIEGSLV